MNIIIIILYLILMTLITIFSFVQLDLTLRYIKRKRKQKEKDPVPEFRYGSHPFITIQLPVYNEKYVVKRLIRAVAEMDYPKDKYEIQILDDSTDETSRIITEIINDLSEQNYQISCIHRTQRTGYKAGALREGYKQAKGEYIAIFDADFIPDRNFLKKTIPWFGDPSVGLVQTRWGHLNENYSLLTRLQAFGLNAHFSIEQVGRGSAGSFINFNGTAGIWRKECIENAGGWSADTLSEDLDLSYRAQMKGWKFKYLEQIVAPAELPVILSAIRTQQYRWTKGSAETARKTIRGLLKMPLKSKNKLHAIFHLFNSLVFPLLLLAAVLSIPVLFIKETEQGYGLIINLGSVFLVGFLAISFFYWIAARYSHPHNAIPYYLVNFPLFLSFSMGLSFQNAIAVLEGLSGFRTPFVRTPKFNILSGKDHLSSKTYLQSGFRWQYIVEFILFLYFLFGIWLGIRFGFFGLVPFHLMLAAGFAGIFFYTLKPVVSNASQ